VKCPVPQEVLGFALYRRSSRILIKRRIFREVKEIEQAPLSNKEDDISRLFRLAQPLGSRLAETGQSEQTQEKQQDRQFFHGSS
jgi:hypothetical protein